MLLIKVHTWVYRHVLLKVNLNNVDHFFSFISLFGAWHQFSFITTPRRFIKFSSQLVFKIANNISARWLIVDFRKVVQSSDITGNNEIRMPLTPAKNYQAPSRGTNFQTRPNLQTLR